jgi:TP901 family phage tail tape measure protein
MADPYGFGQTLGYTQQLQASMAGLTQQSHLASAALRTAGWVTGVGAMSKFSQAAADASTNLAGMRATASASGQSFSALATQADRLARSFPIGNAGARQLVSQLQGLGITAVQSEQRIGLLGDAMVKLSAATGAPIQQITAGMAQLSRSFGDTGLDPTRITKMGDVLTTLQAKVGGSAQGILAFSQAIAPMAKQAGIGESGVMGISAAFGKMGQDGTYAATAVTKILGDMNRAVRDGTPDMAAYANTVGMTVASFKQLFEANPAEALTRVTEAIGSSGSTGQRTLDALGLDGTRTQNALLSISGSGGLRSAIATATGAYGNDSTAKAAQTAMAGVNEALAKLQAQSEQTTERLGGPLLRPFELMAEAITMVLKPLNAIVGSGIGQKMVEFGSLLGVAMLVVRRSIAAGTAVGVARMGATSGFIQAARGGAALGGAGPEGIAAGRNVFGATRWTGARYVGQLRDENVNTGMFTGINTRIAGFTEGYAQQRMVNAAYAENVARSRMGNAGYETQMAANQARQAERAGMGGWGRFRSSIGVLGHYGSLAAEGYARSSAELPFLGRTADPTERVGGLTTGRGLLKGVGSDMGTALKEGFKTGGVTGALSDFAKVTRAANDSLKDTAVAGSSFSRVLRAGVMPVAQAGGMLGSAAWGGAKGLIGMLGLPGMAIGAATAIGTTAWQTHQADQAARKADDTRISNMSTTDVIDSYRDSIGKATANTVTMADEMIRVSKVLNTSALSISGTTKLTKDELAAANDTRGKVINRYSGSAGQIAAEISGLSINGLSTGEQSAIRVDLARQMSQQKANQVIASTDWTGKSLLTEPGGAGTLSDAWIHQRVAQTAKTYAQVGDSRNLWDQLGGAGYQSGDGMWGTSAHLRKGTQKQVDEVTQLMGQNYDAQNLQYGQAYAMQERIQTANKIIADARRQHVSADQLKYTEQALSKTMGFGDHQFSYGDYGSGANRYGGNVQFSDLLYKNDSGYRDVVNSQGIRGSQVSGGLVPLSQQSPLAIAMAQVGGGYGAMFDNTKPTSVTNSVNAALALPGDANLLDKAVNQIVDGATKAGYSLNQVADAAGTAEAKLNGDTTLPAWQMQEAVRQRAMTVQGYGDAFRAPGANIALSIQGHTSDLSNTGTDPASVKRRQDAQAGLAQDAANLRDLYAQRIQQNQQYNIQLGRSQTDFQTSMGNQHTDFLTSQARAEQDYGISVVRANRNFNEQVLRSEQDFHLQRQRSLRDFALSMTRGAEDAAKSMYAPFQRIQVQQVWDGRALQANLEQQTQALALQERNLQRLRKAGLSNQAIQTLDLANTANAQQTGQLVDNAANDPSIIRALNSTVAARQTAATGLYNDTGNTAVQRSKEDFQKSLKDQATDFATSAKRTRHDFAQSLADQYADYTKSAKRAEHDFTLAQQRETTQFNLSLTRMHEDLINSQKVITGDLASLQATANKGLKAGEDDWSKIMSDGLSAAQAALDKFAPGYLATIRDLQAGVAGLATPGGGVNGGTGPQSLTSGGPAASGGYNAHGGAVGDAGVSHTSYDRRTGETTRSVDYVAAGTGQVVGNPRGNSATGDAGGAASNYRPSSDFMAKHPANPDFNKSIAKAMIGRYGWGADEYDALVALWNRESGWNQYADNASSAAYGIAQSLPATKMASFGADWRTNPATQIAWGLDYIKGRYRDPRGAMAHENQMGWYAQGSLFSQATVIGVGEKGPEAVIPLDERGVNFLAAAMGKYVSNQEARVLGGVSHRTYVTNHVSHSEDHSVQFTGPVRVEASDPGEMARKLEAKARMANLTKPAVKR